MAMALLSKLKLYRNSRARRAGVVRRRVLSVAVAVGDGRRRL
jgi:hypothetical protein